MSLTEPDPAKPTRRKKKPKLSRLRKPEGLSLEDWQIALRRQFGREQKFRLENLGERAAFSEFLVTNPASHGSYHVTVRGRQPGDNSCTCPDFATNALGTCKHIEYTLARLERSRAAVTELKAGYHPDCGEVYLRYGARREVRFCPPADPAPELVELAAKFFDADGTLVPAAAPRFDRFLAAARKFDPDLRCGDDVRSYLAELRDATDRAERVAAAFPKGPRSAAFNTLLRVPLYDYQREGALFAARAGRCLIGDEMGLGKTAQAIAAAEIMAKLFGVERVLVVCPTSLKHQWKNEIARFTGRPARVVEGLSARRSVAFADPEPFFLITNYDTVHADLERIAAWGPDLVILDEAQRIKNWSTRVARSVKQIRSPYAVVLTGTPLENRLEELVSIVEFVDRHRLGPTYRLLHEHQVHDKVGKVVGYRDLGRIGQTLAPVLLRRHKDEVLAQLPERIDSTVFVPMTPQQRELHTEAQEVVARIVAKWRRYQFLSEVDKQRLMAGLQRMRMSCDSTYLLDPETDHGVKVGEAATVLSELLETPGTKVVVFSQWVRMHDLMSRAARKRKWGHVRFHGGVPGPARKQLIEQFRDDPACRLFLSTDAGGVGLNLQFASAVLNMDLPWNPAVLEQRVGRVHRLGQRQPVRVVNFVAKGTIEEGMLGVLKFKTSLFAGVLDGGEADVDLGGTRLTKFMEAVEATTAGLPTAGEAEAEAADATGARREFNGKPTRHAGQPATAPADAWAGLLRAGAALLQQMSAAATPGANGAATADGSGLLRTDAETGEPYLRLPVPSPDVVRRVMDALGAFLGGNRG